MSDRETISATLNSIESSVGANELSAYQVFTRMKRLVQAAQAQAPEPVAVADKGVINWIDGKQFDHEADLYTQPAVNQQLLEALKDARSALRYVRETHGELYGVGFDRVEKNSTAAIAAAQEQSK